MNEGFTEPRTALWALAEVCWIDAAGQPLRAPATLEDTSPSGACIRVKTPISVGSNLTIKWHREQFAGVAKNCRTDGREFLLGIQRLGAVAAAKTVPQTIAAASATAELEQAKAAPATTTPTITGTPPAKANQDTDSAPLRRGPDPAVTLAAALGTIHLSKEVSLNKKKNAEAVPTAASVPMPKPATSAVATARKPSHNQERNTMESKGLLPKFWRRQPEGADAKGSVPSAETPANQTQDAAGEAHGQAAELLSYDDIYHAAGILSPRSGYGIHKVLEMLNSGRIRDLAPEIKRASVLMAIEAAGASPDDVLQDAMRRQHALDTYEAGQQRQIEEFESRKAKENSQIQGEIDRLTAHYAERIQRNQDQIAQEKESLRNWQMAKQHESQRIAEVMTLCMREPAPVTASAPAAAAARAGAAGAARSTTLGPSLLPTSTHEA